MTSATRWRWVAIALLDIEPRLWRIRGYRFLRQLRAALVTQQQQRKHAQEVA